MLMVSLDGAAQLVREAQARGRLCVTRASTGELGGHLADCARRATTRFFAYERLAAELEALHAEATLIAHTRRCGDQELEHARVFKRLALARGGTLHEVRVRALAPQSLEQTAAIQAVDGCVHETYEALSCAFQAEHAADPELREAFSSIAQTERAHAALAQKVHSFLLSHLDEAARTRVLATQEAALRELMHRAQEHESFELARAVGLPRGREVRRLVRQLAKRLGVARRHAQAA